MDDNFFYKKKALVRFHLSKELSRHRKELELKEKYKSNDLLSAIFSSTITIVIAITAKWNEILVIGGLEISYNYVIPIVVLVSFPLVYWLAKLALKKRFVWLNKRNPLNHKYFNADEEELRKRCNSFNYDIFNQVYFVYSLVKENESLKEILINRYNVAEAIFNLNRIILELKDIFPNGNILDRNKKYYIPEYRIVVLIDLLFELFELTRKQLKSESEQLALYEAFESFKFLIQSISKTINIDNIDIINSYEFDNNSL